MIAAQAAADDVRYDTIDGRPALDAFLHQSRTSVASAHVAAGTEEDGSFLVGADDAFFNLCTGRDWVFTDETFLDAGGTDGAASDVATGPEKSIALPIGADHAFLGNFR